MYQWLAVRDRRGSRGLEGDNLSSQSRREDRYFSDVVPSGVFRLVQRFFSPDQILLEARKTPEASNGGEDLVSGFPSSNFGTSSLSRISLRSRPVRVL